MLTQMKILQLEEDEDQDEQEEEIEPEEDEQEVIQVGQSQAEEPKRDPSLEWLVVSQWASRNKKAKTTASETSCSKKQGKH